MSTGPAASRHAGLAGWAREQVADRRVRHALFYLLASVLLIVAIALSRTFFDHYLAEDRRGLGFAGAVGVAIALAAVLRLFQTRIENAMTARFTRAAATRQQGLSDLGRELGLIAERVALQQHLVERLDQILETTGTTLYLRGVGESYVRAATAGGTLPDLVSENDSALVTLRLKHQPAAPDGRSALQAAPQLWPVTIRGQLVGVIAGGTRNHAESLDPAEVSAVAALSDRVAATLVILDPAMLGTTPIATPPASSASLARDNLPRNLPELIGRDRELAQLHALIAANRLVTVTGSGGVGKTRLVIEAGTACLDEFTAGVWLIEFAPLADADLVPTAVTSALGIEVPANRQPADVLISRLKDQRILLVLDNCEHVVGAVASLLEALLAAAPTVKALVSSQELIGISGEQVLRLPSLGVPDKESPTAVEALGAGAVRLFVERARAVDPTFVFDDRASPIVASICRRLDGIPLALEMAAARVPMLGLEVLAQRLDQRFRVLTGGKRTALPRQRTLHATLDWSFGLLAEREAIAFRRIAIFAGGFTLDAATAVATGAGLDEYEAVDGVASLVAKSLVTADTTDGKARYRLLETTRAYALEKLAETNETTAIEAAHARYFRRLFASCFDDSTRLPDIEFRARYSAEIDNLRLAVDWAFSENGDIETGQALLGTSVEVWQALSLSIEMARLLDVAVATLSAATPAAVEAPLWFAIGITHEGSRPERSIPALERTVLLARGLRDDLFLGAALARLSAALALAGRADEASALVHQAQPLLEPADRPRLQARLANTRALIESARGNGREAAAFYAVAVRLARAGGCDALVLQTLGNFSDSLWMQGDLDGALAAARDALAQSSQSRLSTTGNVGLATANLHGILVERGELAEAAEVGRSVIDRFRDVGVAWVVLDHYGLRLAKSGLHAAAARVIGWNDATVRGKAVRRQVNEQRAYESTLSILRTKLPTAELDRLLADGAALSEDEICRVAIED